MSPLVTGGCEAPGWVKRSPHKRVRLDSSNRSPHSQACGTCGVSSQRTVWRPRTSRSPSASARAGRSATSSTETMGAMRPQSGAATGATARNSLSDPHSSASKCENPTWRRRSTGRTAATASRTSGNIRRGPVWKSSGSSSTTRYWLKLKPPGTRSTGASWRRLGLHGRRTQEDAELTPLPMMRERRVLVLDDDEKRHDWFREQADSLNWELHHAWTVAEAIESLNRNDFD